MQSLDSIGTSGNLPKVPVPLGLVDKLAGLEYRSNPIRQNIILHSALRDTLNQMSYINIIAKKLRDLAPVHQPVPTQFPPVGLHIFAQNIQLVLHKEGMTFHSNGLWDHSDVRLVLQ